MVRVRNRLSLATAGGPRQFGELRDRVLIRVENIDKQSDVLSELDARGLRGDALNNAPVISAEPRDKIEDVLDRVAQLRENTTKIRQGIDEISEARDKSEKVLDATQATLAATQQFLDDVQEISDVVTAEFVNTQADFGPENLRFKPSQLETLTEQTALDEGENLEEILDMQGVPTAWEETRGENAIVAVFDTGFAENLIGSSRTIATFHGGETDSVYAPAEGHGTMCAGAAAANKEEGVPFNGAAPEAGVILVRITDSEGQIRGDIISKAWDWLMDRELTRPIVANHSYGTPLCSGRPRTKFCDTVENDVIRIANADENITSVYAAGNEAMRCGHRLLGFTNAITGTNSLQEVITVGALLGNGREAQRYSSHGRGDCSPVSDPKPNVSCPIPKNTYYGAGGGWEIKDMSTGIAGSAGGTSHASPTTAGMIALLQSKAASERDEAMQTEEIKQIIQNTAKPPRRTHVNTFGLALGEKGYDARFGFGNVQVADAIQEV